MAVDGEFEFGAMQNTFNEMAEELERAKRNKELQEKQNQQLYAGIAHDLKTPMTMILGYAKVLESKEDISREDKQKYLETIVKQTELANHLLDSLLAYARLGSSEYSMKPEEKDIAECLRTCVAEYYNHFEDAQIQIDLQIPEKQIPFPFDETEMKRVFYNLLSNMVKHNPPQT